MLLANIRGGPNSLMTEVLQDHIRLAFAPGPLTHNQLLFFLTVPYPKDAKALWERSGHLQLSQCSEVYLVRTGVLLAYAFFDQQIWN